MLLRYLPLLSAIASFGWTTILANPLFALENQQLAQQPSSSGANANSLRQTLIEELNLSPQQQQEIEQIRQQYYQSISESKKNAIAAQQKLVQMMAGTNSAAEIREQHQKVVRLQQELGQLHFESMLATREVLSPQQRQQFARLLYTLRQQRQQPASVPATPAQPEQ